MSFRVKIAVGSIAFLLLFIVAMFVFTQPGDEVGLRKILPDGSTLLLKQTTFTDKSFLYQHESIPRRGWRGVVARLERLLPKRFRSSHNGGALGSGGTGGTNLYIVTVTELSKKHDLRSQLGRLQIGDEQGDWYDACWGASTLGMIDEIVHAWNPQAFPRRSDKLSLRFLGITTNGVWTNCAEFKVSNPAFGAFPQWEAEPWPITKTNGILAVTLKGFESGSSYKGKRGSGDRQSVARKTRWEFAFQEKGKDSENWRIQNLTIQDATGNK